MTNMLVQSDGKILIIGRTSPDLLMAMYRFLPDGSPDITFNGSGAVFAPLEFASDNGVNGVLQSDGRIVLGEVRPGAEASFSLFRYFPNGSIDGGFGTFGGYTVTTVPGSPYGLAGPVLQPDGKIVVAATPGPLFRFHAHGAPDLTFGNAGSVSGITPAVITVLAVQNDGKVLVGGERTSLEVLRLNPDGTPDTTFANTGRASIALNGNPTTVGGLIPMSDGRILIWAANRLTVGTREVIARLLPDGTPDTSFNGTGWKAGASVGPSSDYSSARMLLQPDGRILLVRGSGFTRLLSDGSSDTGFGTNGNSQTTLPLYSAALLPAGPILTAGQRFTNGGSTYDLVLAHYQSGLVPGMVVEEPAGTPLSNGASLDFGLVAAGSRTKVFTLRNPGSNPLTGISVSLTAQSHPGEFVSTQPGAATLAPGAQTTFAVTFTPSAPLGPRTATLNIASSDVTNNPFVIPLTGTRATGTQAWRVTYFGSADNSGPGADLNDFDHDGTVNLMEYATGSHPLQSSPPAGQLVNNGGTLTFTWSRPAAALTELVYQPEAAVAPGGPWSKADITTTVLSDNGVTQTVQATTAAAGGRKFVRLRVTRL